MQKKSLSTRTSRNEAHDAPFVRIGTSMRTLSREKPESWWISQGEKKALSLFRSASKRIPAYKDFLKRHSVKPESIRTIADFKTVPVTDKKNYILKYPLSERCWDGNLSLNALIAASSGTTGAPTLWPRGREQEVEAVEVHEQLFLDLYELDKYKTLLVVGFPMGIYISGMATALPSFFAAVRHENLTIITPGNNKESILKVIPELQKQFEQIILVGHPFFVKDVIETGKQEKIVWSKTKLRTFFCSEGFSEEWREYVASHVKGAVPHLDFFNTYGSSELLLMGYESPETIKLKKQCEKNDSLTHELFGRSQTPYIFQYNPVLRYIETSEKGELLFTANAGVPLIRFNLHDSGVVLTRKQIDEGIQKSKLNVPKDSELHKWNYPFVVLFGRSDYTLVYYAVNIYPENVHRALSSDDYLGKITGKFAMVKTLVGRKKSKLTIFVELAQGVPLSKGLQKNIQIKITQTLLNVNMEYTDAVSRFGKGIYPKVILKSYRDPYHFPVGLKPRYIV